MTEFTGLKPNMKCRVVNGSTLIEAGTIVTLDGVRKRNKLTDQLIMGATGKVMANVPGGGALMFAPEDLEPA